MEKLKLHDWYYRKEGSINSYSVADGAHIDSEAVAGLFNVIEVIFNEILTPKQIERIENRLREDK